MHISIVASDLTLTADGKIPAELLEILKGLYGEAVSISGDDAPYEDSKWYNELHRALSPGDVVRTYRTLSKLTQTQLGEMIGGKSKTFISEIENGRKEITIDIAEKLGKALGRPSSRFQSAIPDGVDSLTPDEIDQLLG